MTKHDALWMIEASRETFELYTIRKEWEKTNKKTCEYCGHSSERYNGPITVEWDKGHVHEDYDILLGLGGHIVVKTDLYKGHMKDFSLCVGDVTFVNHKGNKLPGANNYVEVKFPIVTECAIDFGESSLDFRICPHCGATTKFQVNGLKTKRTKRNNQKTNGIVIHRKMLNKCNAFQLRCAHPLFCIETVRKRFSSIKVKGVDFIECGLMQ